MDLVSTRERIQSPMLPIPPQRPELCARLTGAELRRWYYLRSELAAFARILGISAAGSKRDLTDRIAARLDGRPLPIRPRRSTPTSSQLTGGLTTDTVIPVGQRSSQLLRAFFTEHVGPGFGFDAAMRSFLTEHAGSTLGDAIAHWHATRTTTQRDIGEQFELNRITRGWHAQHPGGSRADLLAAWRDYRSKPIDQRDSPLPQG